MSGERMVERVPVDAIHVGPRHRALDETKVEALAASIAELGRMMTPISVFMGEVPDEDGVPCETAILIAGAHRLAAVKRLGWQEIEAFVLSMDPIDRELWEIDENLARAELTPAEVALHMARRKALWEKKTDAATCGTSLSDGRKAGPQHQKQFAADTAAKTGKSKDTIQRAVVRGEKIAPDVLQAVTGTELDKGTHLDALAKLPREEQRKAVAAGMGAVASKEAKRAEAAVAKEEADDKIADLLATYVPGEHWDALKANLYTAGYKGLAQAFVRLIGVSVFDNTKSGAA